MTEHQVPQQVSSLEQLLKQPHVTQIPEFLSEMKASFGMPTGIGAKKI